MKPSIIYLFVSPSGRAYAGWHGCDHAEIPRRGTGPLPDKARYKGSGRLWENVARKHGPALRWVILRRFPGGTPRATTDAAEQRAIRLVRRLWGERCANINAGGLGFTSEEARQHAARLWADPDWADRQREVIRETRHKSWSDPSWSENQRQVIGAATATQWRENEEWAKWQRERLSRMADDPDWRAKNAAVNAVRREKAKTPEAIAKWRAKINSPETKAKMSASRKASPKVLALFEDRDFQARRSAAENTPEARSKRLSTIQRKRRLAHNRRIAERWRFYVPPVLCHGCARLWMPAFGGRLGIWGPWPGFTVPKEEPPQQAAYTPEARARAWVTRRVNEGWRQLASVRPDLFGSG